MDKGAWRATGEFLADVVRRFYEERALQAAGSLSYTTLLSLVPLFTVALALSTAFPVFDDSMAALQVFILENFLPDARGIETIAEQIRSFTENAGRLTAIGIAFFVVTAVMLMFTIDEALNRIFRVQRRRPMVQQVLIYWAVITLGPVLIGGSLSMTSFAIGASFGLLNLDIVADALLRVLPFIFTCAALTLLYAVVPYRYVEPRHALASGILAGVLFEIAKRAFAIYLTKFPTYTLVYGAFATIPIFLVWLYVSWAVVLAGATLTAMLPSYRLAEGRRVPGNDLVEALAVLGALARAQAAGHVRPLRRLSKQVRVVPHRCEAVLERARDLGWTARTERDGWLLTRDADDMTLQEIYRAFILDPYLMGRITAVHALGDVWGMGAAPQAALAQIILPVRAHTVDHEIRSHCLIAQRFPRVRIHWRGRQMFRHKRLHVRRQLLLINGVAQRRHCARKNLHLRGRIQISFLRPGKHVFQSPRKTEPKVLYQIRRIHQHEILLPSVNLLQRHPVLVYPFDLCPEVLQVLSFQARQNFRKCFDAQQLNG